MQNRRLDPTGLAKRGETRGLPGMWPGLDRQEAAAVVFGQFCNRTEQYFLSESGQLAGSPDLLLVLAIW